MQQQSASLQARDRVRAKRYIPKQAMTISSKTIGTELTYKLSTENLSRSGMLLSWNQAYPIPFIENTILEMHFSGAESDIAGGVSFLGKVVRKMNGKDGVKFGIAICQIDAQDLESWESFIGQLNTMVEDEHQVAEEKPFIPAKVPRFHKAS